ncbi:MAG: hypothetical protein U5N56_05270 [Candidatus Marinimicrobia bacterium]|nr:hypothetical protein [Candidatus Neomarinimicrobiota bacterium]
MVEPTADGCLSFGNNIKTIGKHINKCFSEGEPYTGNCRKIGATDNGRWEEEVRTTD